jgi:hypothetical protein
MAEHLPLVHWQCLPPWLFCIRIILHLPCPEQIQAVPAAWVNLSWELVQQVRRDDVKQNSDVIGIALDVISLWIDVSITHEKF